MKKIIVLTLVIGIFATCLTIGWQMGYFKAVSLLLGGHEVDTSDFPNRWERGKLLGPVIPESPFITSYYIANNGTHTFKSYHVKLPPFGYYRTRWYQVPNEDWEEFEAWLNTPIFEESRDRNINNNFYRENFTNEYLFGITAYDSTFTNCTINKSTLYHAHLIDSNVTDTFVYASLFETAYFARYIDISDGRASYNITSWWENG